MTTNKQSRQFVDSFRHSSPYIHAFRGRMFVIGFGGEAVDDPGFANIIHDIALLNSLGIRLLLIYGVRPQVERRLKNNGAELRYVNGLRVTDDDALPCVKEAVGTVRLEIEAALSCGLANSPMAGARIRVASGNFVTARPLGVREGVDYMHTGEVRRVDVGAIEQRLSDGAIVLLSPLGYSPTGELFNLSMEDVATAAADQLQADKLIFLSEGRGPLDGRKRLLRQLSVAEAEKLIARKRRSDEDILRQMKCAIHACRHGVRRVHLIDRSIDGGLLLELFTRDGIGTLITDDIYEGTRSATIEDIGGILELIAPLEEQGILVRRSRELLEMEINYFTVVERDGMIIACAALYPNPEEGLGEIACLAVHAEYASQGRGNALLDYLEREAQKQDLHGLFLLTTRTSQWFREHGYQSADLKVLPLKRRSLYNYRRGSKVLIKTLA